MTIRDSLVEPFDGMRHVTRTFLSIIGEALPVDLSIYDSLMLRLAGRFLSDLTDCAAALML